VNVVRLNTIYNEDCLETMKRMPDNFVDLILTDPPYGIGEARKNHVSRGKLAAAKDYGESDWDDQIPSKEVFDEVFRVSKNQIIFGGNYFIEHLRATPCWIVWDKNNGDNDFADCELAWTSFKSAVRRKLYTWNGMLQGDMKNKEQRYHPTQKPVPLMRWILSRYSKDTDLIYDPFMGSGTTARACKDLGRNYIGSEISKEYCDVAEQRLRQGVLL
jgi:site-specific DNA-methyltransferase (adenine-specific)